METGTPVRIGTVFDVASVTKPFTATAILMLVEAERLRLDDPITKFVSDAPATWKDVTIRHLLSHTSGIRGGAWVECEGAPLLYISGKRYLQDFIGSPLLFPPGHGAAYSDPAYFLLGMVIEKVSGLTYRDFMQQRIFAPAGMASSRIMNRQEIVQEHASCYALRNGVIKNDRRVWQHDLPSYFGMQSTADDLAQWGIALNRRTLLTPTTLEQMWNPTRLADGTPGAC